MSAGGRTRGSRHERREEQRRAKLLAKQERKLQREREQKAAKASLPGAEYYGRGRSRADLVVMDRWLVLPPFHQSATGWRNWAPPFASPFLFEPLIGNL